MHAQCFTVFFVLVNYGCLHRSAVNLVDVEMIIGDPRQEMKSY